MLLASSVGGFSNRRIYGVRGNIKVHEDEPTTSFSSQLASRLTSDMRAFARRSCAVSAVVGGSTHYTHAYTQCKQFRF